MGRGSSGTGGSVTRLTGTDGKPIDLTGMPLKYGGEDKDLTGNARKVIESFEEKRSKNKIEYSRLIDADGNIIEENRGGRGSVNVSVRASMTAAVLTHNHPRSGGKLGGTFSNADINNFANYAQKTYRAAAPEGTYSISKLKGFDAKGLKQYYIDAHREAYARYQAASKQAYVEYNNILKEHRKGNATYEQAMSAYDRGTAASDRAFNAFLVEQHNALLAGQKKYGYTYTLERRR